MWNVYENSYKEGQLPCYYTNNRLYYIILYLWLWISYKCKGKSIECKNSRHHFRQVRAYQYPILLPLEIILWTCNVSFKYSHTYIGNAQGIGIAIIIGWFLECLCGHVQLMMFCDVLIISTTCYFGQRIGSLRFLSLTWQSSKTFQ